MSGFVNHDYVLVFDIRDPDQRQRLKERCDRDWQGDSITETTWEISNDLSPQELEAAIHELLGEGDRAAYYYLSDAKRIFRVDLA